MLNQMLNAVRGRKAHVYCVGAAKTGTTSIAQSFNGPLRTAHEPEVEQTTQLIVGFLSGRVNESQLLNELRKRDKRLNLELESSHPLGYVAPYLVRLFPEAKFIVTIRDPKSWLKSRINFHQHRQPQAWQAYRDYIWSRHHQGYSAEESVLQDHGLYSVRAYLKQYLEQYQILFDALPQDRTLIIKTHEINQLIPKVEAFLGMQFERAPVHTNQLVSEQSLYDQLPNHFVAQCIDDVCAPLSKWLLDGR